MKNSNKKAKTQLYVSSSSKALFLFFDVALWLSYIIFDWHTTYIYINIYTKYTFSFL